MQEIRAVISGDQSISAKITSPKKLRGDISSGGVSENYYTKKEINEFREEDRAYVDTSTGHSLGSQYENRTLTISLLNKNGQIIASTSQTLDEDENKYVESGIYDSNTKSLIFTYTDGTTFSVELDELFGELEQEIQAVADDLQTEISAREAADTALANEISDISDELTVHTENVNNPHNVTKAQVGLGNVDNTSDLDKPISTATQIALNTKADEADLVAEEERATTAEGNLNNHISVFEKAGLSIQDISINSTISQYAVSSSKDTVSTEELWESITIPDFNYAQHSSAYGNGYFVSVGENSSIIYSIDGENWTQVVGPSGNLKFICYGNGYFLLVKYDTNYTVYKAHEPNNAWKVISELKHMPKNLQYINNKFVAICEDNLLLSSADGANWEEKLLNEEEAGVYIIGNQMNSIAYGTYPVSKYLIVGDNGKNIYSYKGINWLSSPDITSENLNNILFVNKTYLVNSDTNIFYSANGGNSWTRAQKSSECWTNNYTIEKIIYGESRFYAIVSRDTAGQIWYSSNGQSWILATGGNLAFKPTTITYGNDCYIITGNNGNVYKLSLNINWNNICPDLHYDEYLWTRKVSYLSNGMVNYSDAQYVYIPRKVSDLINDAEYITKDVNDLENYYTKSETYTKLEINTALTNYYTKSEINTKLANDFYNKTESDDRFVNESDDIPDADINALFDN